MTQLSMLMVCSQCEKPILDKFVLTVLEKPWHPNCVRCSDCGFVLNEKCFSREGKIYCREDFYRWESHTLSWIVLKHSFTVRSTELNGLSMIFGLKRVTKQFPNTFSENTGLGCFGSWIRSADLFPTTKLILFSFILAPWLRLKLKVLNWELVQLLAKPTLVSIFSNWYRLNPNLIRKSVGVFDFKVLIRYFTYLKIIWLSCY